MPAVERSLKSVVSKVCLRAVVWGSAETGLKSATAIRMLETPAEVSVLNQSWAWRKGAERKISARAVKRSPTGRRRSCV
jgi:hypothetical protein